MTEQEPVIGKPCPCCGRHIPAMGQMEFLHALRANPEGLTVSDIVKMFPVQRPNISGRLSRLYSYGIVDRQVSRIIKNRNEYRYFYKEPRL